MKRFFTSDHHFDHANIIKLEPANRVDGTGIMFSSVEQMNEYLIARWNEIVGADDLVYHLGDASFKRKTIRSVLPRLNGRKILICGNHDPYFKRLYSTDRREQELARQHAMADGFEAVHTELVIDIEGIGQTKLSHYPYAPIKEGDELYTRYLELRPKQTGEAMLIHGHVHSQWKIKQQPGRPLMVNAGVDAWGLRPPTVEDLLTVAKLCKGEAW